MSAHSYKTPSAFRQALEDRIQQSARGGLEIQRRRQLVVFTRLLARIEQSMGEQVVLKGGFALELRLDQARTTRDIDVALFGPNTDVLGRLQRLGQLDLGDFMTFEVQPDKDHPDVIGDGAVYGGKRFRVEGKLAGKEYGAPFGLDVAFGGELLGAPTIIQSEPYLEFAGIASPALRVLPIETHIAEKLHAYTLPRPTTNSRVRDLPDLALIATLSAPQLLSSRIREAIDGTFRARATHPVPSVLPEPPAAWEPQYAKLAADDELRWRALADVTRAARAFLDPVLGAVTDAVWDRARWRWTPR